MLTLFSLAVHEEKSLIRQLTPTFILDMMEEDRRCGDFDAVVLFIDTSGFTPLTIRLTAHGRDGAEILADILQTVFEPLVTAIYAHGGFIAGFAGDAFKAVFLGLTESSYFHALSAAEQIRAHMSSHPKHETKYGTFDFSVRISMADGHVRWSVWSERKEGKEGIAVEGAQSHSYTFAGPAIEQAIKGEDHSDGGELVVTQPLFDSLQRAQPEILFGQALTGEARGYVLIRQIKQALPRAKAGVEQASATDDIAQRSLFEHASSFYPASLLTAQTQGEFRPVYTLFVNVQQLPEPGATDDFLPDFFRLLHKYGGYLCRIGRIGSSDPGGTFLLFWGAPTGYENDLAHVLNFVLDLRSQINSPLRAGITHATVYAGFVGSVLREEYTCHGRSVNQAARQMGIAKWDQILLDKETAQRGRIQFDLALAGRYQLKGQADEQALYELTGKQISGDVKRPRTNFVGRSQELAQLRSAVAPIFSGQSGGLTVVSGEAGIGKSRLVHEVLGEVVALGGQVLSCQFDEILRESLNPFRYFLRSYFNQDPKADEAGNKTAFDAKVDALIDATTDELLNRELRRTRSFLGGLVNLYWPGSLYDRLEPQLRFDNMLTALKTLLLAESLRQPTVILLEDAQWLDGDSHEFLGQLTRNVQAFPLAILATTRPTEKTSTLNSSLVMQEVPLTPLSEIESSNLAWSHLGGAASSGLLSLLIERSEGNPFFIEQLLLYLQEHALLVEGDSGWQLVDQAKTASVLSIELQTVLIARLDRLAQEVKQVVQTAAVLGREFSVQILSLVLRNEASIADKVHLAAKAAVWDSLTELHYLFRHALLRDAAYEMQLRAHLRGLHQAAAEAIEAFFEEQLAPHYADLVYHYHHAAITEKECIFAQLAGEVAAENFANSDAITYFSRALELTSTDNHEMRYKLQQQLEQVHKLMGNPAGQLHNLIMLSQSAEALSDPMKQAEVQLAYTDYCIITGDYPAAVVAAQQTIHLAKVADSVYFQSEGYQKWGRALWHQSQFRDAQSVAMKALALARSKELRKQEADALVTLGIVYWHLGDYAVAQQHFTKSLPIHRKIGDPFAMKSSLLSLALVAQITGDDHEALKYFQKSLSLDREMGARKDEAGAITLMVNSYLNMGEYGRAIEMQLDALPIIEEVDDHFGTVVGHTNLGLIATDLGEYAQARSYFDYGLKMASRINSRALECNLLICLSKLEWLVGELNDASLKAEQALSIAIEIDMKPLEASAHMALGNILLTSGQDVGAKESFHRSFTLREELAESNRSMEAVAGMARVALYQDDLSSAIDDVQKVLDYLKVSKQATLPERFQIYETCIQVLQSSGDQRAQTVAASAYHQLQERAANIYDDASRHSFLHNVNVHRKIVQAYDNLNS